MAVYFYRYWGMLCCDWKEHRQKVYKLNYLPNMIQMMLKGKYERGVQICVEGFISAHEFGPRILIRIQPNTSERLNWKKKKKFCKPRWCSIVALFSGKYDKTPLFKVSTWPFIPAGIYVDGNITFTPGKSKLTWRC